MKRVALRRILALMLCGVVLLLSLTIRQAAAAGAFPDQTANGSVGIQGTITSTPPTRAATITVPANGATFTTMPITVSGLCPTGVLVKLFSNNVFIGAVFCSNGSYSIQANLFSGQNALVTRVYDALDQAGPDSNAIIVTYNDGQYIQFGTHVTLSSDFSQRGALPGQELSWPITLSGGNGPYAISIDWGDGSPTDLLSQAVTGSITLKHTYKTAGVYKVIVKAVDKNGGTAFLQLVGQATGAVQNTSKGDKGDSLVLVQVVWWPALLMVPLLFAAFWVGRRHELFSLRKQLEKSRGEGGARH